MRASSAAFTSELNWIEWIELTFKIALRAAAKVYSFDAWFDTSVFLSYSEYL